MLVVLIAVAVAFAVILAVVLVRRIRRSVATDIRRDPVTAVVPGTFEAGLAPTRRALGERLGGLFGAGFDDALWSDLEDALVAADVGVAAAMAIVERVRASRPGNAGEARAALRSELLEVFSGRDRDLGLEGDPAVVVVVGVNGSGKTTTIAKLAALLEREGRPVLLGAADTFRAAAVEQLTAWAERLGIDIVAGQAGADAASVAFDALEAARARGKEVLIVDTAGRLHSKRNLMEELGKVVRVLRREAGSVDEVLLVLDGTTGQNGIAQARAFTEAVGVTGAAITKLDGTARGGVAVAVEQEMGIPVKFVGVGERIDDLLHFEAVPFVDALLGDARPTRNSSPGPALPPRMPTPRSPGSGWAPSSWMPRGAVMPAPMWRTAPTRQRSAPRRAPSPAPSRRGHARSTPLPSPASTRSSPAIRAATAVS